MSIGLRRISKRYGAHQALHDVSVTFDAGQIVGLAGPNGAGKTTLLRVAAGLIRPTSGIVIREAMKIRYFGGDRTLPPDVAAATWLRLWDAGVSTGACRRPFRVLSRGTRQRLGLEAVLAPTGAACVLLDEPWEGLDPDASRWLSERLIGMRNAGATIVVSSHRIHELASVCNRCEFLVGGRIVSPAAMAEPAESETDRTHRLFVAFDRARGVR